MTDPSEPNTAPATSDHDAILEALGTKDVECPGCQSNMKGLDSPVCPECGRVFTMLDLESIELAEGPGLFERLGSAAWLGVAWALLPAAGGFALLYFIRDVSGWLGAQGDAGIAIYTGVFIVTAGLGLLPTYAQAFLGGWAFGAVPGTIAALVGFVGASLVGRPIAQRVGRDRVDEEMARNTRARAVRDSLLGAGALKTLGIVTLIRVPPNSPFALTNLVLSTTRVPLWIYIVGTAVGMLPRTALVVWAASQIEGEITKEAIKGSKLPWGWSIGIAIVVLLLLAHLGNKAIERVTKQEEHDALEDDA